MTQNRDGMYGGRGRSYWTMGSEDSYSILEEVLGELHVWTLVLEIEKGKRKGIFMLNILQNWELGREIKASDPIPAKYINPPSFISPFCNKHHVSPPIINEKSGEICSMPGLIGRHNWQVWNISHSTSLLNYKSLLMEPCVAAVVRGRERDGRK